MATRSSTSPVRRRVAATPGLTRIPLFRNTSAGANRKAIAIGLTQGRATLAAGGRLLLRGGRVTETRPLRVALPGSGVLVYYVNELVPQGEGPVILRDKNLLTPGLGDAFFSVGDVIDDPRHRHHLDGAGRHGRRTIRNPGRLHAPGHGLQPLRSPEATRSTASSTATSAPISGSIRPRTGSTSEAARRPITNRRTRSRASSIGSTPGSPTSGLAPPSTST